MSWLKLIPRGVWVALLAALVAGVGWMQYRTVTAERDALEAQLERSQAETLAMESALEWRRQHAQRLAAALEARERDIRAAQQQIRGHLAALDRLEGDDEQVREYLERDLPGAVADWVRALADPNGDRAGAGDPGGATPAADAAARPDAEN